MYYLDMFQRHKSTNKSDRIELRKAMMPERDFLMSYRLKLQRNMCFYCGDLIDLSGHLDHIVPVYYGGGNNKANLAAACRTCNIEKSTGQIEITNPYTINDYLKLQKAYKMWQDKIKATDDPRKKHLSNKHRPKRVQLYAVYRADLFKEV